MNVSSIAALLSALIPGIAAIVPMLLGQSRIRRNLRHDIELLKELPENSDARASIMQHVEWQAARLRAREETGSREVGLGVFAIILAVAFGYSSIFLFGQGVWWSWLLGVACAFVALVATYGVLDSFTIKERVKKKEKK
ncbi:hypothetical protein [Allonocardiopsis opalescens]|uniref:hypothetical protein n=1 Tax=Allonocardiopsis opalescens TaxID=1144618 RepID=UPI0011B245A9|nr:hypothetical protein [Allonocardiopsis opalescens]